MFRFVLGALVLHLCVAAAIAQFDIRPKGPFNKRELSKQYPTNFEVVGVDPDLWVEEYDFQLYVNEGQTTRTVQSQAGQNWWMPVNVLNLPVSPEPQLSVTLRVRHRYSGQAYTVTKVYPIRFVDPVAEIGELPPPYYLWLNPILRPLLVGQQQAAMYYLSKLPPNTRSASLMIIGPTGDTVARNERVGNPYLTAGAIVMDSIISDSWPGALRLRGRVDYDEGPAGGYFLEKTIPDSIPVPTVEASAGFGPFRRGVDLINTFVVKGLGSRCDSVQWLIEYQSDAGRLRTPVSIKRAYSAALDSMHFTYNMRDLSPNARLTVRASFGPYVTATEHTYELPISREAPVFTGSFTLPYQPSTNRIDTVTIDSLPARVTNLRMIMTTGSGRQIAQQTIERKAPFFIRKGSLTFASKDLALGTYVVRVRALNDFQDDTPDFFFGFDVRDTSAFFLIADSWGPYTRGDSATITPAITDVRPYKGVDGWEKIVGRFVLVDSLNPTIALFSSPDIDLSGVRSRDSVVYWPDESYVFGKPIETRFRLPTVNLPLTAQVRFERVITYPGRTVVDNQLLHPVFVVPAPGKLTTTPRLDTSFIATRKAPLSLRLSDIVPEAKAVRFALYGTKDPEPVIEQLVALNPGQTSVSTNVDAGLLPVNARLVTTVLTQLTDNYGAEIVRTVNTTPDTLTMQAIPPIDTLTLDWDVDPATHLIKGVSRLMARLTFSNIPAQTRRVEILSYSDVGDVIDSISVPVPYRVRYDSALTVSTLFPFRTFNVVAMQVRYLSDGGPMDGIRYTRKIVSKPQPMEVAVRKMNYATKPPTADKTPIRQGSNDLVDITLLWRENKSWSDNTLGYMSSLTIDSVRLSILDCAGNVLDDQLITPTPAQTNGGMVADTVYPVRRLPLSTERVRLHLYSKSLTLPSEGVTVSAPLLLRTNPVLSVPLGQAYPSYRVSDTTMFTLNQVMTITNTNGIEEVDSITIVDRNGKAVITYPALRPYRDVIQLPAFDFTKLNPDGSPYRVTGLVRTRTCAQSKTLLDTMVTLIAPRVVNDPSSTNWVYSSEGWGPFQQGRAPSTQVVVNSNPASFITQRAPIADSLELSIVGVSRNPSIGIFTPDRRVGFSFAKAAPLPEAVRCRDTINLNPFDTASSIALHVRWLQRTQTGVRVMLDTLYSYPVRMLEFPDQLIEADTAGLEQSVLAGSSTSTIMPSFYSFLMRPQSSAIDQLTFAMRSSTEHLLDTLFARWESRDVEAKTSVFVMQRDVGQYPWPYIARDRQKVDINIGYLFTGATKPTKIQKTAITILPRAEWLNGAVVTLNGTSTKNSIPIRASIPMPTATFNVALPMFGDLFYKIVGKADSTLNVVVDALYDPKSRQFTMVGSPKGSSWVPSVSLFSGANHNIQNTAADGAKSGEFSALYRFEKGSLADNSALIENRELRLRSLSVSNSSGGVLNVIKWIYNFKKTIEKLIQTGSLVASGGLVSFHPTFVLKMQTQQVSTINIGTTERGALMNIREHHEPSPLTEPDEFPTSQAVGLTIIGGGAVEAELLGLIGLGVSYTQNYMFGSGSTFSNSIAARERQYYPTALDLSSWLGLELNLFFGLVNIELFAGRLAHDYEKNIMPSFEVFSESWGGLFAKANRQPKGEQVQNFKPLARIYNETPFYRPAPSMSANGKAMAAVHTEHSLLGSAGRIVLSSLDRSTHSLKNTATIASNRNGIHDATVAIYGHEGSALVAWVQNQTSALSTYNQDGLEDLLKGEDVHLAFYDATTKTVQTLPVVSDVNGTIDVKPMIAIGQDTTSALVVWSSKNLDLTSPDVYCRRIIRDGATWKYGEIERIASTPGVDHDVNVAPLNDGGFLVTWMSKNAETGSERVVSAVVADSGVRSSSIVTSSADGTIASSTKMVGNGNQAVLLYSRSIPSESGEFNRALDVFLYQNGSWSTPRQLSIGNDVGIYRHLEADMTKDGVFFTMVDAVDFQPDGVEKHKVVACVGSATSSPSEWKLFENEVTISSPERAIWSLSTAIGPDTTLYVATQELDSLRGNNQQYFNGLQLGPSRLNAVVRAFRLTDNDKIVAVPFGNTPVSVRESAFDDLERKARYRVKVLDPTPNPAQDASVISLIVQRPTTVSIKLVDNLGNPVTTVFTGLVSEGIQGFSFETSGIPTGRYSVVVTDEIGTAGSVPLVIIR